MIFCWISVKLGHEQFVNLPSNCQYVISSFMDLAFFFILFKITAAGSLAKHGFMEFRGYIWRKKTNLKICNKISDILVKLILTLRIHAGSVQEHCGVF